MRELIQLRYQFLRCYNIEGLIEILNRCAEIVGRKNRKLNSYEEESLDDLISDIEQRIEILKTGKNHKVFSASNSSDSFKPKIILIDNFVDKNKRPPSTDLKKLVALYRDRYHIPASTSCYISYEEFPKYDDVKMKYFGEFIFPKMENPSCRNELITNFEIKNILDLEIFRDLYLDFIKRAENFEKLESILIIELSPFSLKDLRKEYLRMAIDEFGANVEELSRIMGLSANRVNELIRTYCEYREFDSQEDYESEVL